MEYICIVMATTRPTAQVTLFESLKHLSERQNVEPVSYKDTPPKN
jgi:hypothetical protein